ncbi:hypothetical protein NQ318_000268 [Aromia moschata]|uniref:Peptidase S1 domain-containing protein n=1 Tax=Aromia moschata TaxID=1265417 RepID=A0AAV8YWX1_9CUCU|nr:hypothetical protein NQ318_000268 [Aromia moschata]
MLKLVLLLVAVGAALGLPREYSAPGGRIVGGREADISEYPWTLALLLHYQHYCGAVLIQPEWALTVAHCVDHGLLEGLSVRAGSSSKSIGGEIVDIIEVFLHPEYDPETVDFDFAVCRLASPVQVIDAMPVELPEPGHSPEDGHIAHISGWGQIENEGPTPDMLHAAEIPVIPREDCERIYGERITRSMFCAGGGNVDACLGDSGGPVVIQEHLAGLISGGFEICGTPGYPGVYADVGHVTEWIVEVLEREPEPPEPEPPGPEPPEPEPPGPEPPEPEPPGPEPPEPEPPGPEPPEPEPPGPEPEPPGPEPLPIPEPGPDSELYSDRTLIHSV